VVALRGDDGLIETFPRRFSRVSSSRAKAGEGVADENAVSKLGRHGPVKILALTPASDVPRIEARSSGLAAAYPFQPMAQQASSPAFPGTRTVSALISLYSTPRLPLGIISNFKPLHAEPLSAFRFTSLLWSMPTDHSNLEIVGCHRGYHNLVISLKGVTTAALSPTVVIPSFTTPKMFLQLKDASHHHDHSFRCNSYIAQFHRLLNA
jgi:hypothetical protein